MKGNQRAPCTKWLQLALLTLVKRSAQITRHNRGGGGNNRSGVTVIQSGCNWTCCYRSGQMGWGWGGGGCFRAVGAMMAQG